MQQKEPDRILSSIAREHHTTVQEVRKEMMLALEEGQRSTDPNVQAMWSSIPRHGPTPTLEEVMDFLIHKLKES